MTDPRIARLIAEVANTDATTRVRAIAELGLTQSPDIIPILIGAVNDIDTFTAGHALWYLGVQRAPQTFDLATQKLTSDNPMMQSYALRALGALGNHAATDIILPYLHNTNEDLRNAACDALGKLGDPHALQLLIDLSKTLATAIDKTNDVLHLHSTVVEALGNIGSASASEAILPLLDAEYWYLWPHIIRATKQIGDARAVQPLTQLQNIDHMLEHWRAEIPDAIAACANRHSLQIGDPK